MKTDPFGLHFGIRVTFFTSAGEYISTFGITIYKFTFIRNCTVPYMGDATEGGGNMAFESQCKSVFPRVPPVSLFVDKL